MDDIAGVASPVDPRLAHDEVVSLERLEVERVAGGRELAAGEAAPVPYEDSDGVLVVPVVEEILVVERCLMVREELHIRR